MKLWITMLCQERKSGMENESKGMSENDSYSDELWQQDAREGCGHTADVLVPAQEMTDLISVRVPRESY